MSLRYGVNHVISSKPGFAVAFLEHRQSYQHNEELLTLRRNMMLTVSHDLRSPLTSIMGYADLIAETTKDEKCKQYEEAIKQSSDRMLTLLNTLLSYYRLDTGKEEVEMVPFRVKNVLNSLLVEYEPIAEMKNVEIVVSQECSYHAITTILGQSFGHYPVEVHFWYQVLHAHLDRGDITLLGYDADIGSAHPIFLSGFLGCVVAVIIHDVGASQLLKVVF